MYLQLHPLLETHTETQVVTPPNYLSRPCTEPLCLYKWVGRDVSHSNLFGCSSLPSTIVCRCILPRASSSNPCQPQITHSSPTHPRAARHTQRTRRVAAFVPPAVPGLYFRYSGDPHWKLECHIRIYVICKVLLHVGAIDY